MRSSKLQNLKKPGVRASKILDISLINELTLNFKLKKIYLLANLSRRPYGEYRYRRSIIVTRDLG